MPFSKLTVRQRVNILFIKDSTCPLRLYALPAMLNAFHVLHLTNFFNLIHSNPDLFLAMLIDMFERQCDQDNDRRWLNLFYLKFV